MKDLKKGILIRNGVCVGALGDKYFSTAPIGTVLSFAGQTAPHGYLLCDGSSYKVAEYTDLYAVIGNTYGGDTENFNVPNLVDIAQSPALIMIYIIKAFHTNEGVDSSVSEYVTEEQLLAKDYADKVYVTEEIAKVSTDFDYIAEPYEFNGKKSAWFGDSITKGFLTSTTNVENTFVNIFCNLVKLSYTNYGLTSSLWTTGYRDLNTFLDTIKETNLSDCDYVFINGGLNDYHSSVTISDFTHAVDETLSYLKNNFNGKIIIISPFNSVETSLSFNPAYNLQTYRNIIREKCIEYGCTYIAGISLVSPSTTSFASTTYFVDNYHLNQSGHYLAGTRLAERFLNCNISSNIYTEEEQIVGCWINGKPIYRKVIHIGQFPSTTGTFYTKHNIDNLNVATKVYGIGIDNDRVSYPLPWSTNTNNAAVSIFMGRTTIGIATATDQSTRFIDSYAIVEYTKTTD